MEPPAVTYRARGFSLIELVIVVMLLGIAAVLITPRLTSAAHVSRDASLRDQLHRMRTQIMIYRAHHGGVAPGYSEGNQREEPSVQVMIEQLVRYSNSRGTVSAAPSVEFRFGPYLDRLPANPINGSAEVRLIGPVLFPDSPVGDEGWMYQPSTGLIAANVAGRDAMGRAYFDY
jgi:general secretion pathway protein G